MIHSKDPLDNVRKVVGWIFIFLYYSIQSNNNQSFESYIIQMTNYKKFVFRSVVVAQLEEQSLPTQEVRSLNTIIGKMYVQHLFTVNCSIEKTKIKKKEADNASLCCSSMFVRYNKVIFSKKAFVCFRGKSDRQKFVRKKYLTFFG